VPFEVPEGWVWCKLEDIVSFGGGKTPSMDNKEYWDNGKHLWVTSKDMKCSHITNSLMKITEKALEGMTLYKKGTLLVVTRSGILRHTLPLSILEKPATVNQDLKAISPHIQELSEYLYVIIKANEHIILKEYHKDGTTVDSIDFDKFRCLPIPLAPIAEQKRIIATAKNWFSLIDQIEQGTADLQTTIKQTKSKILDLAIHGKLVPQDPNDEPAIELLKRINPDFTPCDNGHYTFEIPKSWMWCKLGDIAQSNIGLTYKPTDITDNGIPVYRSNNIRDRKIDKSDLVRVNAPILEKQFLNIGDLLICVRNGSRRLIGKCAIIEELDEATSFGAFMAVCRSEYNQWIFNLLNTIYFDRYLDDSNSTAINQITQRMLLALPIPLPPLAEQQRIVQKIEELFSVLDNIQNALEV
jgi:type I restriction enzyme S subunit